MQSDLERINTIVFISSVGPVIVSLIAIAIGIQMAKGGTYLNRLEYLWRILGIIVAAIVANFVSSRLLGPSEQALREFRADQIIPSLWALTIASLLVALVAGFFLGKFTAQRTVDMGRSRALAYLVLFSPAIFYFLFAKSRDSRLNSSALN